MSDAGQHSRREFLSGRGAAQSLAAKLQAFTQPGDERPASTTVNRQQLHVEATRRAMACEFQITYHQEDTHAAEPVMQALDLIEHLEAQLTIYRSTSEVIEINRTAVAGPVQVEPHLFALLQQCQRLHAETDGAFDITSTPLSRVWGFLKREGRLPSDSEIERALSQVDSSQVLLDESLGKVEFAAEDVEINLNAVGKGYALDRIAAGMDEMGVTDYLCHGGGSSVLARGENRSDPDHAWTIGLRHPLKPSRRIAEIYLRDRALATAGGGTQFFEHEGISYSHVIDPRTGWPVHGRFTATVLAPSAAEADALSTALFAMDIEKMPEFCAARPEIGVVVVSPSGDGVAISAWGVGDDDWQVLEPSLLA